MDTFYTILVSSHSGLRWLLLAALLASVIASFSTGFITKSGTKPSKYIYLVALILSHLQLIIGIILYFISPKVIFSASSMKEKFYRFFLVEHISLMVMAIILITIGYSTSKKNFQSTSGQKRIFIFYFIALLMILLAIPWPWQSLGTGWF